MTDSLYWSWASVVPQDQTNFPQQIGFDPTTGDLYLTQSENPVGANYEKLTISRFVNFRFVSMMTGLKGHGTPLRVEHQGGTTYLTFAYQSTMGGPNQWVRLPFIAGKNWTAADALGAQYAASPLPTHSPTATKWMQGEVEAGDIVFRLVGGPFDAAGPTMDGGPAQLQIIRAGAVTQTLDASMLGRGGLVTGGSPINGRLEPEGLASSIPGTPPILVIAIANGRADNSSLLVNLYAYSLDRAIFLQNDAPAMMLVGTTTQIQVTVRNTGFTTWTPGQHCLGEGLWPPDPTTAQPTWGTTFYPLANPVHPDQETRFTVPITATIPFADRSWQMVRDPASSQGPHYFGVQSARVHIAVVAKLDHLVLYRPGAGTLWILRNQAGGVQPRVRPGRPRHRRL